MGESFFMDAYPESYVYRLFITNRTLFDLRPAWSQLSWGVWQRDGVDGELPAAVPAGATVEALGIRASKNNSKGYECRCAWELDGSDPNFPDAVTLFISVPLLSGNNRAGLDARGRLTVSGWTGVSRLEHGFTHRIVVSTV